MKGAVLSLYASFKKYKDYELEGKTTNHHNCRKSALLSLMLIKSKLLLILGTGAPDIESGVAHFVAKDTNAFKAAMLTHAERYFELASMIFDLQPYVPLISEDAKQEIITALEAKLSTIADVHRQARALITLYKVRKVFGVMGTEAVKEMHEQYLRILELDSKPEKGERKLADDLVILIHEVLELNST